MSFSKHFMHKGKVGARFAFVLSVPTFPFLLVSSRGALVFPNPWLSPPLPEYSTPKRANSENCTPITTFTISSSGEERRRRRGNQRAPRRYELERERWNGRNESEASAHFALSTLFYPKGARGPKCRRRGSGTRMHRR